MEIRDSLHEFPSARWLGIHSLYELEVLKEVLVLRYSYDAYLSLRVTQYLTS